jgi:hypothetical protein
LQTNANDLGVNLFKLTGDGFQAFTHQAVTRGIDREGTARLMLCVLQGLRVVGKTGRTHKELLAVVEAAMKTLD